MAQFSRLVVIIFMVSGTSALAQQRPPSRQELQQKEQELIEIEAQKALARKVENIYKAENEVNGILERVCNSVKISLDLTNSNLCRAAAAEYVATHGLPADDGLELKTYKLEMLQTMCNAPFRDQRKADSNSFFNRSHEDSALETRRTILEAALKSMQINERSDCSDKADTIECRLNIIEDVKRTTILQLDLARRAREEAAQVTEDAKKEKQAELANIKKR